MMKSFKEFELKESRVLNESHDPKAFIDFLSNTDKVLDGVFKAARKFGVTNPCSGGSEFWVEVVLIGRSIARGISDPSAKEKFLNAMAKFGFDPTDHFGEFRDGGV